MGYGIARVLVEFVREPDAQVGFILAPFTKGQPPSRPLVLPVFKEHVSSRRGRFALRHLAYPSIKDFFGYELEEMRVTVCH